MKTGDALWAARFFRYTAEERSRRLSNDHATVRDTPADAMAALAEAVAELAVARDPRTATGLDLDILVRARDERRRPAEPDAALRKRVFGE